MLTTMILIAAVVVPAWVVVKLWGGSRPAQSVTPILAEAETKPKR